MYWLFCITLGWFNKGSRVPLPDKQSILGGLFFKTFNDSKTEVMILGPGGVSDASLVDLAPRQQNVKPAVNNQN